MSEIPPEIPWSNPGNITADDNADASSLNFDSDEIQYHLRSSSYGFTIPGGATIDGIEVQVERLNSGGTASDNEARLAKAGVMVGADRSAAGNWPTTRTVETYGSPTDLWGTTWTPAEVNAAGFGFSIQALATNASSVFVDYHRIIVYYTVADSTPPTPDPMTFATAPNDVDTISIDMTATTASDPSTPVEYLFTYTACGADGGTGGTSSAWQTPTSYTDTGLQVNQCYGYTVTARDSVPNTGTASSSSEAYTAAAVPGTPTLGGATATTLDLTNAENGNPALNPTTTFAVQVVSTAPVDATWLNQWVDATGNPSVTEVWMDDATLDALTLQGLASSTTYGVKVKARNGNSDETLLSAEGQGTTSSDASPVFVDSAERSNSTSDTNIIVDMPTNIVDDMIYVIIGATIGATDPAGTLTAPVCGCWTQVFHENISATSGVRFGVYRKKSNGSEPATYTWTISVASHYAAIAASYRNAVEIPDVVSSPFNTGSGLNPSSPDVTTTVNNTKVLRIFGADDNDASDPTAYPSAHTGRNTNTEGGSPGLAIGLADVSQATAGATGAAAWTLDASEEWGAVTIALAFADTTAPTPDPMTFATAPNDASTTSIDMTATTASDPSLPLSTCLPLARVSPMAERAATPVYGKPLPPIPTPVCKSTNATATRSPPGTRCLIPERPRHHLKPTPLQLCPVPRP